jgi:hypothetical protein
MDCPLTDEQRDFLLELLRNDLSDLRGEITRTDNSVFKETLKVRESALTALIDAFEAPASAS